MLILKEEEISLTSLAEHLIDAGFDLDASKTDCLTLRSERGLGFYVMLDTKRAFIQLRTFLPVRDKYLAALDFTNDLNLSVFLGSFALDEDNDLLCTYAYSYSHGIIFGQFVRIVNRFSGMLDHVLEKSNGNVFDFEKGKSQVAVDPVPAIIH